MHHTTASLHGSHLRTYQSIFQHPVAHNLAWQDVHSLLRQLAEVTEEPNGNLRVARHGETLVLHPNRTKEVSTTGELMALRHFLERSEPAAAAVLGATAAAAAVRWLLVIDHHAARIFRSEGRGTAAQQVSPHEPADYFRHAHHSRDFSRGREKPDPNSFFEPVVQALKLGGEILVFGTGTGTSSEMDQFVAWVQAHHPEIAGRIIGAVVVDEHHLTEDQLLAKARAFHAGLEAVRS